MARPALETKVSGSHVVSASTAEGVRSYFTLCHFSLLIKPAAVHENVKVTCPICNGEPVLL